MAMKAVLLAGGLGTRMREETEFRPKPMVEVGGRPVLWHIMKNLGHYGINDFIVATGYKSDLIKEYFLNYEARNNDFTIQLGKKESLEFHDIHDESRWRVTITYTGEETPTGGRLYKASKFLDGDPFLVTYGDGLADVDISALQEFHRQQGTFATVTTVQPSSRFGVMDVGDAGKVRSFREKPQLDGWINIGFFIMQPEVLTYLHEDSILEEEPLAALASDSQLSAFRHTGFWQPMDTYRENRLLNDMWDTGTAPWQVWS
jgi:glucose-1-phosphate cytidylyltransferase